MERLATDVGQFAIGSDKLYLTTITDMGTNEIVAYDVSRTASLQQMNRMPGKAWQGNKENRRIWSHASFRSRVAITNIL